MAVILFIAAAVQIPDGSGLTAAGNEFYQPGTSITSRSNYYGNDTPIYEFEANSDLIISGISKWDSSGYTLATGDVDGDGKADLIIGAYDANSGPNDDRYSAGEIYVVFGDSRTSLTKSIDLLTGADIVIYGVDEYDHAGETLTAGDINGDGLDDIIIGVPNGDGVTNSEGQEDTGEVAVIFGRSRSSFNSPIDLSKDYDLIIYGKNSKNFAGSALAVGNIDNDSYNDLIITADHGDGPSGKRPGAGDLYVFFGKSKYPISLKCANADYSIYGSFWGDSFGASIAVGDVDNDHHDDLLIGAPNSFSGPYRNSTFAGECYLIFGNTRANLGKELDLENITNSDLTIFGADENDNLGTQVALADIDNDGYADLIMGADKADGPNNARINAGDIYVVKGDKKSNLLSYSPIDLSGSSNIDLTIYGADPKDRAGSSLTTGDFNGDGVPDIVIGSALADGRTNSEPSAGEAYLIYGNISIDAGTERDLGSTGPDLVLYSTVKNSHAGYDVAIGDIDGDGKDDVIVGSPYSDVKDGSVKSAGKSYVIYGTEVVKRLKNIGFKLDGIEDYRNPVCYARSKPYTFEINVTDSIGINDIQSVKLILDPEGIGITFTWEELTDVFTKNNDPDNYIEFLSTSTDSNRLSEDLLQLKFRVQFSGNYPDESFHNVMVLSKSDGGLRDSDLYSKIYKVENDLEYRGTLKVAGGFQGPLMSGSWIQSNESVFWTGLSVIYEGGTDVYPPNDYFKIVLEDDDGDSWYNDSSSGGEFIVESHADIEPDFSDFYTLTLKGSYSSVKAPPPIQYELKIASPNVTFLDPTPDESSWFSDLALECGITITDQSGGEIIGSSIQYAVSTSGKHGYGLWQSAGMVGNALSVPVKVLATFDDGDDNYIKWRAKSAIGTLGDIYSGSKDYRILVDASTVYFKNAFPEPQIWSPQLQVTCGITILDRWTGVDANTVEYAYATSGLGSFTNWISAGLITDKNEITVEVQVNYYEGLENYIKWRADDTIGNGYVVSDTYRIKVSTQKPVTTLFLPSNNTELSTTDPVLTWSGFDPNNDKIFYDVYVGTELDKVSSFDASYLVASEYTANSLPTLGLLENTDYYWTVIPNDGIFTGYCESGIWTFSITLEVAEPRATLLQPLPSSKSNRTAIELAWTTDYSTTKNLSFEVYLDTNPVPLKLHSVVFEQLNLNVDGLLKNTVYYWTVVPVYKNIHGKCLSGIWSFEINETYRQFYNFSLSVNESELSITWGSKWEGYLELSNNGNGMELIELTGYAGALEPHLNITTGTYLLKPNERLNMTINISIPDGFPVRSYNIILQAVSSVSNEREAFVLIVNTVGTKDYYKGFESYDTPGDGKPIIDNDLGEEVPILIRNIFLTAFALVIAVALTVLLVIRASINKANERAIIKLKYLIAKRRKEILMERKQKQSAAVSGQTKVQHTATPVPSSSRLPVAEAATPDAAAGEKTTTGYSKPEAGAVPAAIPVPETKAGDAPFAIAAPAIPVEHTDTKQVSGGSTAVKSKKEG